LISKSLVRGSFFAFLIVINKYVIVRNMAYSKQVVERFESVLKNPEKHSVGRFDPTDPNVASGMVGAPSCGDVMKLDIKLNGDTIEDVKFKTYGCGSAIASSTLFVDMLKGRTIEDAKKIKDKDIAKALELPPIKLHCSVLAEASIKKAVEDWENKKRKAKEHKFSTGKRSH
jgi:nitrogen fixation NifU-like protein